MQARKGDLRGADKKQVVASNFINLVSIRRKETSIDHHLFSNQYGWHHWDETIFFENVKGELDERKFESHCWSHQVGKSTATIFHSPFAIYQTQ